MIIEVIVMGFAEQTSAMRLCMQWRAHPYTVQWINSLVIFMTFSLYKLAIYGHGALISAI